MRLIWLLTKAESELQKERMDNLILSDHIRELTNEVYKLKDKLNETRVKLWLDAYHSHIGGNQEAFANQALTAFDKQFNPCENTQPKT